MDDPVILSVGEMAALCKVTHETVLVWIREKRLPGEIPFGQKNLGYEILGTDAAVFIAAHGAHSTRARAKRILNDAHALTELRNEAKANEAACRAKREDRARNTVQALLTPPAKRGTAAHP